MSEATKNAIKVGLSLAIAVFLALSFGWEKPYWSAIAVIVMATAESYGHALQKGSYRILGTLFGVVFAFVWMSLFAQQPGWFFLSFVATGAVAAYMSAISRFSYAFKMTFVVAVVVSLSSGLSEQYSFYLAVLRVQETLLGVACFTVVHALLWPRTAEQQFFVEIDAAINSLLLLLKLRAEGEQKSDQATELTNAVDLHLTQAKQYLLLPQQGGAVLRFNRRQWQGIIHSIRRLQDQIVALNSGFEIEQKAAAINAELLLIKNAGTTGYVPKTDSKVVEATTKLVTDKHGLGIERAVKFVIINSLAWGAWIFAAIPGGFLFPIIVASLSNALVEFPASWFNKLLGGVLVWACVILVQYIFLMPLLSHGWQLAAFYFVNAVVIWRLFYRPQQLPMRMLGLQLLVMLTMTAQHLRPVFDIVMPLKMLMFMIIAIVLTRFVCASVEQFTTEKNLA